MNRPERVVGSLQLVIRKAQLARRVRAVASGKPGVLSVDLGDIALDPGAVFLETTRSCAVGSPALVRLVEALRSSGTLDALMDGLADDDARRRRGCARLAGALRLEAAVPWLGTQLQADERPVRRTAARALGRIGGARSAEVLLAALRSRRLPWSRLIIELTRAAPDLFIESSLRAPQNTGIRAQLAAAAGLRRHKSALEPLRRLAVEGTERERATACRGLGLLGGPTASPEFGDALRHRSWRVRFAAARALGEIRDPAWLPELQETLYDPHPRIRYAAARALRLTRTGVAG